MLAVLLLAGASATVPARNVDETLRLLPPPSGRGRGEGLLRDEMRRLSHLQFERRRERYEALKTPEQIAAYQRDLRERFIESLGGFPARTPLNPRITGTFGGRGFHGEKIIFESLPGVFVTGLLYLPDGPAPHPVVLMPCGHAASGKAGYQQPAITLAQSGLAVFCIDPIGQGERRQIPGSEGSTTVEHIVLGVAPILLGRSIASYMVWDGIRAIDYLETRTDLDVSRLGCAGNSGGGMMAAYLMALEPRIVSAATSCFMTTSRYKNESPGPGDTEQNFYAQYAYGFDHPDFVILHAPQPALICSATRDFVPILGAWDAFRQAKRIYTRLGFAERVDLIETDARHGFSVQLREGVARWMRRWLLQQDDVVVEEASLAFNDDELACTPEGQVLRLPGARSIFDLNREEAARLAPLRNTSWSARSDEERRRVVRESAAVRPLVQLPAVRSTNTGSVRRKGYRVDKLLLTPAEGVPLPALHFVPERAAARLCLYLHGRGKHVEAGPGGEIESLVQGGAEVLAVDLRGLGETAMIPWRYVSASDITGDNGPEYFIAYMLGRSLAGMRAEDTLVAARQLVAGPGGAARPIELVALEAAAIPALLAAALEPQLFSGVRLVRSIDSWERVLEPAVTHRQLEGVVHGALRAYDLPDLARLAGDVTWSDPIDATGAPLLR